MNSLFQKLKNGLEKRTFVRRVALVAGGTALGQGLVVLASPLLTRLYTPEDFGMLSVFVSIFSLLLICNSFRYELAIPLIENDDAAANMIALVLGLVILTTLVFGLAFWIMGDQIAQWVNMPDLKPYLGLLALSLLAGGFYQAFNFWAIRKRTFDVIAQSKLTQSLGLVVTQLGFGILGIGSGGLPLGIALGQVFGNPPLARRIWLDDRHAFRNISLRGIFEMANRYRRFPLFTSWSSFLMTAGLQLPTIMIVSLYGADVGGHYGLGQRVIGLPMSLIGVSVGQAYMGAASRLAQENPVALQKLYMKTARYLVLIGILPIGFLALTGPWLFALIFGEEWRTAGYYVQILAPMFLTQFVTSSLGQNIYVIERQDLQSMWDIFRLASLVGVFALASVLKLEPFAALGLYSVVMTIAYALLFGINSYALKQHIAVTV